MTINNAYWLSARPIFRAPFLTLGMVVSLFSWDANASAEPRKMAVEQARKRGEGIACSDAPAYLLGVSRKQIDPILKAYQDGKFKKELIGPALLAQLESASNFGRNCAFEERQSKPSKKGARREEFPVLMAAEEIASIDAMLGMAAKASCDRQCEYLVLSNAIEYRKNIDRFLVKQ